jgi:hypothetical protein
MEAAKSVYGGTGGAGWRRCLRALVLSLFGTRVSPEAVSECCQALAACEISPPHRVTSTTRRGRPRTALAVSGALARVVRAALSVPEAAYASPGMPHEPP